MWLAVAPAVGRELDPAGAAAVPEPDPAGTAAEPEEDGAPEGDPAGAPAAGGVKGAVTPGPGIGAVAAAALKVSIFLSAEPGGGLITATIPLLQ